MFFYKIHILPSLSLLFVDLLYFYFISFRLNFHQVLILSLSLFSISKLLEMVILLIERCLLDLGDIIIFKSIFYTCSCWNSFGNILRMKWDQGDSFLCRVSLIYPAVDWYRSWPVQLGGSRSWSVQLSGSYEMYNWMIFSQWLLFR
jgi:hypothetical protein